MTGLLLASAFYGPSGMAQARDPNDAACYACHPAEVDTFRRTGMGRSMGPPSLADSLGEFRKPALVSGSAGVSYAVAANQGHIYQESFRAGAPLERHDLRYAIGSGEHGRSYVIARGDALFLAPLSYYTPTGAWDLSPGYSAGAYRDFLRPVSAACLFCHVGNAQPAHATAISCERCHGPGDAHLKRGSIVNPANLAAPLRDDVCNQCHLGGDIRIVRRGRSETDFRPGTYLDDVVAVFSLPPSAKPEGLDAIGQVVQLRMSRCWKKTEGRLGCITCHDPHVERSGPEASAYYRGRCEQCHRQKPCTAAVKARNATVPPDNCVSCHMPRNPLNRVAHIAHTNHRILRRAEEALNPEIDSGTIDLTHETSRPGHALDPRTKALAYGEAARGLPILTGRALALLEESVKAAPRDADLLGELALVQMKVNRGDPAGLLKQSAELGSQSPEVHNALCEFLASSNDALNAIRACRDAIALAPFDPPQYQRLIRIYVHQHDRAAATETLNRLRAFDPANSELAELARQVGELR